eukprot:scaffold502_cov350-Pavlova_lutheri.AAC.17
MASFTRDTTVASGVPVGSVSTYNPRSLRIRSDVALPPPRSALAIHDAFSFHAGLHGTRTRPRVRVHAFMVLAVVVDSTVCRPWKREGTEGVQEE